MTGFAPILYWFPGARTAPEEYAARAARDGHASGGPSCQGPGEDRGLLLAPHGGICSYEPARQRWDRIGEAAWIGCRLGLSPSAFRRARMLPGVPVAMADGQIWQIPVVNPLVGTCTLPLWERLDPYGHWTREVTDEHRGLAAQVRELAQTVMDQTLGGGSPDLSLDEDHIRRLVGRALALNYDLSLHEISVLRLFGPDVYAPAIAAILDLPALCQTVHAAMEGGASVPFGSGPAPADISPGAPGSIPTTAPAP